MFYNICIFPLPDFFPYRLHLCLEYCIRYAFYVLFVLLIFLIVFNKIKILLFFRFVISYCLLGFLSIFLICPKTIFQHYFSSPYYKGKAISFFFCDQLSLLFIVMTLFIFLLIYIYISRDLGLSTKPVLLLTTIIEILVLFCFCLRNLFAFYLSFELILLPMVLLILLYGSRGRRVWASALFSIYTFASSLFLIISIFAIYKCFGVLNFDSFLHMDIKNRMASANFSILLFSLAWISFSIKLPTMPFHVWLPEAHVEAPTVGSVILAALLLKSGGFGILRVVLPLLHDVSLGIRTYFFIFCIISVFYSSFLAYRHFDIKKIIAYSSIMHMNLSIMACLTESKLCLAGCIISMLCHSIISSGLFFSAGFLYEKFKTRNILYYNSLTEVSSYAYLFIIIIVLANMAIPFTIAFLGELALYCGFFKTNFYLFLLMIFALFFPGLFSFMLIYRVIYFNKKKNLNIVLFSIKNQIYVSPLTYQNLLVFSYTEIFILFILSFQIIFFFFFPDIFIWEIFQFVNSI